MKFLLTIEERGHSWAGRPPLTSEHASQEEAEQELARYVSANWDAQMDGDERPEDADEMIDAYFECVFEQWRILPFEEKKHAFQGETRTTFKAFPEIEFPAFLRALHFTDISWGNDACARAWVQLGDNRALEAWVDYEDPNQRECHGEHRYFCALVTGDGEPLEDADGEPRYFGYTNDLAEFEATIKATIAGKR